MRVQAAISNLRWASAPMRALPNPVCRSRSIPRDAKKHPRAARARRPARLRDLA